MIKRKDEEEQRAMTGDERRGVMRSTAADKQRAARAECVHGQEAKRPVVIPTAVRRGSDGGAASGEKWMREREVRNGRAAGKTVAE